MSGEKGNMTSGQDEALEILVKTENLPTDHANALLNGFTDSGILDFDYKEEDAVRTVVVGKGGGTENTASYKLQNIAFNFRKMALSGGINAAEAYLSVHSAGTVTEAGMHILLLLLKMLAGIKVELSTEDARLVVFLWQERTQRRLEVDEEYTAYSRYLGNSGREMLIRDDYEKSLERLEKMRVIKIQENVILLREKLVIKK